MWSMNGLFESSMKSMSELGRSEVADRGEGQIDSVPATGAGTGSVNDTVSRKTCDLMVESEGAFPF